MATVKQIQFRLRNAKKTLTRLNKEVSATKARLKKFEAELKRARATAAKKKVVKKKKAPAKKKAAKKKAPAKKKAAKKKK